MRGKVYTGAGLRAGHGEERTTNMPNTVVTLEVSKLSGWLNADAPLNMRYMVVTLEVSKLSCWLNADALCRGSKGGHAVQGENVLVGRREAAGDGVPSSVQGRARLQNRGRAWGGAHIEHVVHGCDAGGVEAQRQVERRRAEEHAVHGCDAGGVEA